MNGPFAPQKRFAEQQLANLPRYIERVCRHVEGADPETAFAIYPGDVATFMAVLGSAPLRPHARAMLDPFVRSMRAAAAKGDSALQPVLWVNVLGLASSLRSLGCTLPEDVDAFLRERAQRLVVAPDASSFIAKHWNSGFAALAWDAPIRYRAVAGVLPDEPLPFDPSRDPALSVQGWLAHFAAAVEARSAWSAVAPAWESFVALWPLLFKAGSVDSHTLLFTAEALQLHVRAKPRGETGDFLFESVSEADSA
ncbi:MAG TPA: hypothetical protein VK509_12315 [Polyangiales bacterium]|nr:hypothetical protein [Polyangiales bacterium]